MLCSPGSSRLLTNSGSICSANEESTRLVFYLKQHHPQPPTSEIWKSNVFEFYLANLYFIPKCVFEHYPGTSPLLQQCAHPVKWLLPVTHYNDDKRSSDCVVLCQIRTEHIASFCEYFSVDFRFRFRFRP